MRKKVIHNLSTTVDKSRSVCNVIKIRSRTMFHVKSPGKHMCFVFMFYCVSREICKISGEYIGVPGGNVCFTWNGFLGQSYAEVWSLALCFTWNISNLKAFVMWWVKGLCFTWKVLDNCSWALICIAHENFLSVERLRIYKY